MKILKPIKKIIGVVTGSRAEYFLLRWIMEGIRDSENLELQVIVTGMHLSSEFGLTYSDINKDGFRIDRKVEMLLSSDTPSSVSKSMGLAMIGFADAFEQLQPDLIIVLGDRFEILAASATALIACIPILHIHGGETTEGAFDEAIRHSITKMAHFHFVAAKEYRRRVIQLGEHPERVFQVGGLGIDCINKLKLLDLEKLESSLDFKLGPKNLLVTFHPVTLEKDTSEKHMNELLASLEILKDTHLIFTMPNSDTDGRIIFKMIEEFVVRHTNAKAFTSLGQLRYLSCIKHVDGVIGNSSSGLSEVPSFKKGSINIGDRQRGRLKAESIIDCEPEKTSIINAIQELYSPLFQTKLTTVKNPYGSGGASDSIVKFLEEISLDFKLKKKFYDLKQK
jgi:GDP/UDP-N,N'-diacetylbacillosamine 2-epimerase (hydrolysing)